MNQYHYQGILGVYTCSACNQSHNFSEKNNIEKVRRFLCPHFNWVLSMIRSMNGIKMQVSSSCNLCYKQYSSELKIGSKNFNNQLNTEDTYLSMCCGNRLEVVISLSEEYFDKMNLQMFIMIFIQAIIIKIIIKIIKLIIIE